jgi:hypothetical protein
MSYSKRLLDAIEKADEEIDMGHHWLCPADADCGQCWREVRVRLSLDQPVPEDYTDELRREVGDERPGA